MILYLTRNSGFFKNYYIQATAISLNPPYSNSVNSKIFEINVIPGLMESAMNRYKTIFKKLNFLNFVSNANITYTWFPQCDCNINKTSILMNGFNPNFLL